MFLRKVTINQEDKIYNYYKIVASYRDKDGKPKHRLSIAVLLHMCYGIRHIVNFYGF